MVKHVYIVGAGFSRPLGGPLFTNLLTMEYWQLHSDVDIPDEIRQCLALLHRATGRSIDELLGLTDRLNAEELIALLEWSSRNPVTKRARLVCDAFPVVPAKLKYQSNDEFLRILNIHLKRLIACQCNSFTHLFEADSDTIAPYKSWIQRLTAEDTIITFNYDTAIETLALTCGIEFPRKPGQYMSNQARLIHVHGCVDWIKSGPGLSYVPQAYLGDNDLCIGLPGLEKAKITEIEEMKNLWISMRHAIQEADVVSIVGYSMPATDNMARQEILGSLKNGQRVNLVVGNDVFTSGRMQSMIQPIVGTNELGGSRVMDLKMYAQDYLPNIRHYMQYDYTVKTPR